MIQRGARVMVVYERHRARGPQAHHAWGAALYYSQWKWGWVSYDTNHVARVEDQQVWQTFVLTNEKALNATLF
jgi:hypothetical protein